jgi:hypothetical protein
MRYELTNASAAFQRLMEKILGRPKDSIAFPYLDNVIIRSRTVDAEGVERLRQVLETLRTHGFALNLKKFCFFKTKIGYLGRLYKELI